MVNLWIPADLRTNAAIRPDEVPFHDLMVVAGNVSDGPNKVIAELVGLHGLTGKPILFVPGNRDFCGARLRPGEFHNVPAEIIVLEAGSFAMFGGVRFIGATLWTDFELTDTEYASQKWAIAAMPEYFSVRHSCEDRLIRPIDTAYEHMRDRAKVARAVSHPHQGATVIVTHHAPSIRSLPEDVQHDISCAAFASNLEHLITQCVPEGFRIEPPSDKAQLDAYLQVAARHGAINHSLIIARSPDGITDAADRIALGGQFLAELIATGL